MQNLAQHVGHLGWNIVLELDLEQHLIVAWHLSSPGLLKLRHQDTREAWVREPSNGGDVSGGADAGKALDVVMSQRAGKMRHQGIHHSFFGRRCRVLVLIQGRLAGSRIYVADPIQFRDQLRLDRHSAQLVKEEVLYSDKDNVVVREL